MQQQSLHHLPLYSLASPDALLRFLLDSRVDLQRPPLVEDDALGGSFLDLAVIHGEVTIMAEQMSKNQLKIVYSVYSVKKQKLKLK